MAKVAEQVASEFVVMEAESDGNSEGARHRRLRFGINTRAHAEILHGVVEDRGGNPVRALLG